MYSKTRLEIACKKCYGIGDKGVVAVTYQLHALDAAEKLFEEMLSFLHKFTKGTNLKRIIFNHDNEEIARKYGLDHILAKSNSIKPGSKDYPLNAEECLIAVFSRAMRGCKDCEYKEPVLYELVGKLQLLPDVHDISSSSQKDSAGFEDDSN